MAKQTKHKQPDEPFYRTLIRFSHELNATLNHLLETDSRSKAQLIEHYLWQCPAVRKAAEAAGVEIRPERRGRGRPLGAKDKTKRKQRKAAPPAAKARTSKTNGKPTARARTKSRAAV